MNLITPFYAAILSLLFVVLSVRTLSLRRRFGVAIGPGEDPLLARAVRAHGNFTEYVPLCLLLLLLVDLSSNRDVLLHGLGVMLVIGRAAHAYGICQVKEDFRFRVTGMALTFTVIASCVLLILARYVGF